MAVINQVLSGVIDTTQQGVNRIYRSGIICSTIRSIVDLICPDPTPIPEQELRDRLTNLIGNNVEITTNFSDVTGLLTAVKTDYVVLLETRTNTNVLVPLASVQAVSNLSQTGL
ncbi:hypothetical protein J2Z40_000843 [Cytobacillus eiseniae]|uniref:DUF2642 domain-containing protein n=1 Tax=Cytobacillus eiseniae TaxID=762947 RepID=A0ABS4RBL7_9BACI|nr:DUF2642 domain-containing protein [Cytobacillus eiseniae]MBP2240290.1 hypothetical protein [Cytobacillus eiseniae]